MKFCFAILIFAYTAAALPAQARINCHNDPVRQAKREETRVAEARRRDHAMTNCLRAVGYTQQDWHAYRVPGDAGAKVHACLRKHGVPE